MIQTEVLLVCGVMILAGVVHCGEAPMAKDQQPKASSVGFGSSSWGDHHQAFTVQTGYEGYLVPVESLSIKDIVKSAGVLAAIPILGKYVGRLVLKGALVAAGLVVLALVGLLVTTGLCKYTPFCIHQHWDREEVRSLVSQDKIQSAARLLASAVNKFGQLEDKADLAN